MRKNLHRLLWLVWGGCFLVACSGDETWRPDDVSLGLEKWRLTLICSPNGLGDNGYNDKIFEGVCRFLDVYGDEVEFHLKTPLSIDAALQDYEDWLAEPEKEGKNDLLVLAGSEYRDFPSLKGGPLGHRKVLLFERKGGDYPVGVYTFNLSMYGVSYWAGSVVGLSSGDSELLDSTLVLAAMPDEPVLEEAIRGYSDGFYAQGGRFCRTCYLADGYEGFAMPDSAYRMLDRIGEGYWMVYPLLGGSAAGVYRYSREVLWTPTIGMDVDCSSITTAVFFSVIRKMDGVMEMYLGDWVAGKEWPVSQTLGLSSGWVDIVVSPRLSDNNMATMVEACRTEAVEKDKEYETSKH